MKRFSRWGDSSISNPKRVQDTSNEELVKAFEDCAKVFDKAGNTKEEVISTLSYMIEVLAEMRNRVKDGRLKMPNE